MNTITPDQIDQGKTKADSSAASTSTSSASSETARPASTNASAGEVITPPEDVATGTVISGTDPAATASNKSSAEIRKTENASAEQPAEERTAEDASENETGTKSGAAEREEVAEGRTGSGVSLIVPTSTPGRPGRSLDSSMIWTMRWAVKR